MRGEAVILIESHLSVALADGILVQAWEMRMARRFDPETMAEVLDRLARAAIANDVKLDVAVYGGSALMLASNFRYASEDVDARLLSGDFPRWLTEAVVRIGTEMRIAKDWFNDDVLFHLSGDADDERDHIPFGTFPRGGGEIGLRILVPRAEHMLALKPKAMRINDPVKGMQEVLDIRNLIRVVGCRSPQEAVAMMGKFFPISAASPENQLFVLRNIVSSEEAGHAPEYPIRSI